MNIGIIGTGSAAAVCAVCIFKCAEIHYNQQPLDIKVSVISDPNVPKISVGESLSPGLFNQIRDSLSMISIKDFDETEMLLRLGARHTWENNENTMFDIEYLPSGSNVSNLNRCGAHMSSEKFSPFVFKRINKIYGNKLLEIHDNIKHISQNDNSAIAHGENDTYSFDYIFDCRGFPTKEEFNSGKYNFPEFETVNSVLLFRYEKEYIHPYSEVLFHKNGWQFGINTRKSKAFGYLFNKDITDKEDALTHFKELNKDIPIDNVKELNWPSYSVKKAVDGRIICMGNKLYFYEPIQGIPLHNYFTFTRHVMVKIFNNDNDSSDDFLRCFTDPRLPFEEMINTMHTNLTRRFYEIVLFNYAGNHLNSKFWDTISHKSRQHLSKSTDWMNFCNRYVNWKYSYDRKLTNYPNFEPHTNVVIRQYLEGLNIDPEKFVNEEYLAPK
ncbi:hypothetical protein EB001_21820 [bacterium]|nr:hypothetical protein [bacterium]